MFIKVHKSEYKKELLYLKSNQRNDCCNNQNNEINIKKNLIVINDDDNKHIFLQDKEK